MKKVAVSILFLFVLCAASAWAASQVYVNDILVNPSRHYNSVVEIEGDVTAVTPGQTTLTSGSYTLTDDLDGSIAVRSRELPAIGKRFVVKGVVSQDANTSIPYLRELDRSSGDYMTIILIVVIVAFVALVAALLVVAFRSSTGRVKEAVEKHVKEPVEEAVDAGETVKVPVDPGETIPVPDFDASLVAFEGSEAGKTYRIVKREVVIGREGDIKLPADDMTVSRKHARLSYSNGKFTLTHLSDVNPTKVNDRDVSGSCELQSGDELQMGQNIKLRFEVKS